jgi:hypothetical protein
MRRLGSSFAATAFLLVLGLAPIDGRAEWPVSRRDPARTAIAPGQSSITVPIRYWQSYAGGTLSGSSHVAIDVNGDGQVEIVYLAGGKVIAKLADDRLVWESPPVELRTLHAVADLDGDGALEIVAAGDRNVFVLDGKTGKILWKEADGEVGVVGGVRLGDFDGDGHPDLLVDECGCCGISATANPPGGVYHFTTGALATPTKLYAPMVRSHCGSSALAVGDFDGDGAQDVAYADAATVIFASGKTGAVLGTSGGLGETIYYSSCQAIDLDGNKRDELVCFQDTYLATAGGGRRVWALGYDATKAPTVQTLWNAAPVDKATGRLFWTGNAVTDLDRDGKYEVTVSWFDGSAWSTAVHDAMTGTKLATVAGEKLLGLVDVDGDKKPDLVSGAPGSPGFTVRGFDRTGAPPLSSLAAMTTGEWQVRHQWDFARAARSAVIGNPLAIDLGGTGSVKPVLYQVAAGSAPAAYVAFDLKSGALSPAATYAVPDGLSILTNQVYANVNRAYPQLLLTRNDGYLVVLDAAFAPTNGGTFGTGEFTQFFPGMRVGGFIAAPIAPRISGTSDAVVLQDSRGALVRLDTSSAWMSKPPTIAWQVQGGGSPTTAPTIDAGKPGIVCTAPVTPSGSKLIAVSGAGATLWQHPLPSDASLIHDPLAGDVNGDGTSDIIATWTTTGSVLNAQAFDGKTGNPIWPSAYSEALQWGFQPSALADYDGNGVPDLFFVPNSLRVLNGATGATLANNAEFLAYFTPTVSDVDGDGVFDVTLSRGYYPVRLESKALGVKWVSSLDDRPYQHGARAQCGAGGATSIWVQPSSQNRAVVRLITMNGAGAGTATSVWVAGGKLYPTQAAAQASGAFMGLLGNVAIKKDLIGTGDHPSALIGSTDGFLYAIDPCHGALDWAFDAKFAVGDAILADTSGDGVDEILVPAADGYVHALQQRLLAPPSYVNDNAVNGATVVAGPDVDTVQTYDTLGASWDGVPEADGYQVAVLTPGGTFVTQPDWVNVGKVTEAALSKLSLADGKKYVVSVRAVSKTKGSSVEARSNGVTVQLIAAPDAGVDEVSLGDDTGVSPADAAADATVTDGGATPAAGDGGSSCGCRTAGVGGGEAALALAAIAGALAIGRRGKRR